MWKIFWTAINAVMPIILLIFVGYTLHKVGFLSKEFLKNGNKFVFKVCLPCTLFVNSYEIDSLADLRLDLVAYCVVTIVILFTLGMAVSVAATKIPQRRGAMHQCVFRSNFAVIGMPLAATLGGSGAEGLAAMAAMVSIPLFNALSVVALSIYNDKAKKISIWQIIKDIIKNPLILGVLAGVVCVIIREIQRAVFGDVVFSLSVHTKFLYTTVKNIKSIASPFALIVMGGMFEFSAVKGLFKEIVFGTFMRSLVAPAIGVGLAVVLTVLGVLNFGSNEYTVLIGLFGAPVAVASGIMAEQMGADGQLAAQYVIWTSISSMFTIVIIVGTMMALGLVAV